MRMGKINGLSRRLDLKVGVENENQKLIKKECIREIMKVVVKRPEIRLVKKFKKAKEKNEKVGKTMEEIKRAGFKALRKDKWGIERELLLKERKVYMLKDKKLKLEII